MKLASNLARGNPKKLLYITNSKLELLYIIIVSS